MKKRILTLAIASAMIGALATGCSSSKSASGSDTTSVKDTTKTGAPPAAVDTLKKDTTKKDTTHH